MRFRAPFWLGALCFLGCTAQAAGDPPVVLSIRPHAAAAHADFRAESDLVLIPVSVTDANNHAVVGLGPGAFRVFDNRTEQTVVQFACEDAPLSIGIVFDSSESMQGKLARSREAIHQFLRFANPEDEFFLLPFSTRPRIAVPFTDDAGAISNPLFYAAPRGTTALLDAMALAMDYLQQHARYSRRALLVLSDGGDNHSRYSQREILERVRESDLWIYAIGLYDERAGFHASRPAPGQALLQALAASSGGRHFAVDSLSDLPVVAARISLELRNRYVLGYRPAGVPRDGRYHHVEVSVTAGPGLHAAWRPGYYGPLP